jgi:hypothetical protein
MFSLRRSSAVAGVVAVLSLATAGSAMASYGVTRDTGLYPNNVPGGVNSDCGVRAQLLNDPATGRVYARSYASCSIWKRDITVQTQIKRILSNGTVQTFSSGAVSTPAPAWVSTGYLSTGCDNYQAVVRAWITDDYGRQTYKAIGTTVAPIRDHCPF